LCRSSDYEEALRRIREAEKTAAVELDLSGLFELSRLPPELERLTFLQGLDLSQCYSLGDLEPLAKLIHLQTLHLVDLSDPSLLASLTSLQELSSFHYGL